MIGPIVEVAEKVAEVAVETSKEMAKEAGKAAAKNSVDVSKRVEIGKTSLSGSKSGVDITKRIVPEKGADTQPNVKELKVKQKNELIKNGMSPGVINDCKIGDDGIYRLKTKNESFADTVQPESGVEYVKKVVDIFGNKIEGVFPKFKSEFTTYLPENLLRATDKEQFDYCTSQLKEEIKKNPELRNKFSQRQLDQIEKGIKPSGYTWHHNEELGKMELVDSKIHGTASHTGGKALWGGGTANR